MDLRTHLSASDGDLLEDASQYRRLIGRLFYLNLSRPNITYVVHKLSQYVAQPRTTHLEAVYHLLKYLKSAPGQGIFFTASSSLQLKAFCDADWASCPDTWCSVTRFCIFLGDSLVSWKSKKQSTTSRSSAEAEYRALPGTSEIVWITQLLRDFHIHLAALTPIFCDNQTAIHIATNPVFHERTKHVEIDCHFIRNKIIDGFIKLLPVRSQLQLTDMFTKPLPFSQISSFMSKMAIKNI